MKTLTTYKNHPNIPETTTWTYDPLRGFMTAKTYDDGSSVAYGYDADGRVTTRTWARGITTAYAYDAAGSLISVDYSDSTPDISYTRDTLGRPTSITDAAGTRTLTYNDDSTLASETLPHILNHGISYVYDTLGRRAAMNLNNNGTAIASAAYAYDGMSRLATVSDGANSAEYSRIPGSSLLNTTLLRQGSGGQAVLTVDRDYDNLNRLTSISSSVSIGVHPWLKSYSYEYNTLDKRIKTTLARLATIIFTH